MASKLAAFLVIAAHVTATLALPPCVCTRNLFPVCGSDGETYSNPCLLDCEKVKNNKDLTMVKEGPCHGSLPTVNIGCVCTFEYKPVCGTDGTTYPNRCSLDCQKSLIPEVEVKYNGECQNEPVQVVDPDTNKVKVVDMPPCICTRDRKPVCGSDGQTYSNECLLNCATAQNPRLSIQHMGSCESLARNTRQVPDLSACTCTRNANPVCGSDGRTYSNDCLLNCATAQNPSLRVRHYGNCQSLARSARQVPDCTCTRNANPVCGSDGQTYSNDCLLNCATAQNPSLSIKHFGPCETVKVITPDFDNVKVEFPACTCGRDAKPVCGSDGVTYANDCLLNCATAFKPQLSIKNWGPCEVDQSQDECTCTRNYLPVCGSDGVTYGNTCLLNCARVSLARHAPCDDYARDN